MGESFPSEPILKTLVLKLVKNRNYVQILSFTLISCRLLTFPIEAPTISARCGDRQASEYHQY